MPESGINHSEVHAPKGVDEGVGGRTFLDEGCTRVYVPSPEGATICP